MHIFPARPIVHDRTSQPASRNAKPMYVSSPSSYDFPSAPCVLCSLSNPNPINFTRSSSSHVVFPLKQQTRIQTTTTRQTRNHRLHKPITPTSPVIHILSLRSISRAVSLIVITTLRTVLRPVSHRRLLRVAHLRSGLVVAIALRGVGIPVLRLRVGVSLVGGGAVVV
jgi:hypothetical protein